MNPIHEAALTRGEEYISVDIEAAGPIPGKYSMLSVGACLARNVGECFYAELQPIEDQYVSEALEVSGFSLSYLREHGTDPSEVMASFRDWICEISTELKPVLVGFNASFDWSFINWYFHTFLGENPFGIGGVDIKAYYMGFSGTLWSETTSSKLPDWLRPSQPQTHNALDDARAQGEIFSRMIDAQKA